MDHRGDIRPPAGEIAGRHRGGKWSLPATTSGTSARPERRRGLAQVAVEEKGHEISAFTTLLDDLDLTGVLITTDAARTSSSPRYASAASPTSPPHYATTPAIRTASSPPTRSPNDFASALLYPRGTATGTPQTFTVASRADRRDQRRSCPPRSQVGMHRSQPRSAKFELVGHFRRHHTPVPCVYSFRRARRARRHLTVLAPPRLCQSRLPPINGPSRIGLPSASPACCDRPAVAVSHPHSNNQRLTARAPVAPARVLPHHSLDQRGEYAVGRWASGPARVGPVLPYEPAVPTQDGAGSDQAMAPQGLGQPAGEGGEDSPVGPVQAGGRLVRRSTATSCRNTSSSTSLDDAVRLIIRTRRSTCRKIRYSSRSDTAAIMPEHRISPVTAGQQRIRGSGTP